MLDDNNNPIAIPPYQAMEVGNDGTISIIPQGEGPQTMAMIGRIKIVQAPDERLERGLDGLFRNTDPQQPSPRRRAPPCTAASWKAATWTPPARWCR